MIRLFCLIFLAATASAKAQDMSPAEFEAMIEGTTTYYTQGTEYRGIERHQRDRRVLLRTEDGACYVGHWYARGNDICYVYDENPGPHCWKIYRRGGVLYAGLVDLEPGDEPQEIAFAEINDDPIDCPGPDLGV